MDKLIEAGDTRIGAIQFEDRKRPSLVVWRGNEINVYGTFTNDERAALFVDELGRFLESLGCIVGKDEMPTYEPPEQKDAEKAAQIRKHLTALLMMGGGMK